MCYNKGLKEKLWHNQHACLTRDCFFSFVVLEVESTSCRLYPPSTGFICSALNWHTRNLAGELYCTAHSALPSCLASWGIGLAWYSAGKTEASWCSALHYCAEKEHFFWKIPGALTLCGFLFCSRAMSFTISPCQENIVTVKQWSAHIISNGMK